MSKYYIMMPTGYIEELQQSGNRAKSRAFMEYFIDMHNESVNSIRFYKESWGVSVGTVHNWIKDFSIEIEKFFTYWNLKNNSHYSSVKKIDEHKMNTSKNENEHLNNDKHSITSCLSKDVLNTSKNENEHELNKDTNSNNIDNNINADSSESTNIKNDSKSKYSINFEILWNRYDKKSSNKGRSQTIYLRRWKNTDIKILLEAIDKYKSTIDLTYLKDFDGFLNGLIDTYVPKRAWIIDRNKNKHIGWFYDNENKFITDSHSILKLDSSNIANYIADKRFGYIA